MSDDTRDPYVLLAETIRTDNARGTAVVLLHVEPTGRPDGSADVQFSFALPPDMRHYADPAMLADLFDQAADAARSIAAEQSALGAIRGPVGEA